MIQIAIQNHNKPTLFDQTYILPFPNVPDYSQASAAVTYSIESETSFQPSIPRQSTQNRLTHNVHFAQEDQQVYYPVLEFHTDKGEVINELELIRLAVEQDRHHPQKQVTTFYFFSPPGLGKTVMGGYLAACYECPYQIINCVNSMIDLDLLGSQVLIGENTIWQDGPIPSIIRTANEYSMGILIINELNALTVNAQMALNPLLDKQQGVVLTQNNNEFVQVNRNSHLLIIATMNPDVLGINDIQDSVRDRASAIIYMSYPPVKKESMILRCLTYLDEKWAKKFCEVIAECRKAKFVDRSISKAPSTRALLDWVQYSWVWGPFLAFEMTIANRYAAGINAEEIEILKRIAKGKGVKTWKLPETLKILNISEKRDKFHFKNINPIVHNKKILPLPPAKTATQRRHKRLKNTAERLKINKLENFF